MWPLILKTVLGWLGGPLLEKALDGYKAKLASGNTTERIAADLASRELVVEQREIEVQADYKRALIGHPFEPANVAAYIFVLYIAKVVVWDTMLGLGSTPAIKGNVGEWMALIAAFLFGKRGAENVAMIISGALKRK
jgi:hypothetical protein